MKKSMIVLTVFMFIMMAMCASAVISPIDVPINVTFLSDSQFILKVPSGGDTLFSWDNTTWSSQSKSYTVKYYSDISPTGICDQSSLMYQNLTTNVLSICADLLPTINESKYYREQYSNAKLERDNAQFLWNNCETERSVLLNNTEDNTAKYNTCTSSLASVSAEAAGLRQTSTLYSQCNTDLTKTKSDVTNGWIFGAGLGAIAAYLFINSRKPKGLPGDMGHSPYDQVNVDRIQRQPEGFDGPRQ